MRRRQAPHRRQQGSAPRSLRHAGARRRGVGRPGAATQCPQPLAKSRVGDAEKPAQLFPRAAGRDQPRGSGQRRRQARGIGKRPLPASSERYPSGVLPLTSPPSRGTPGVHGAEVPHGTRQPGHHALVAELPPPRRECRQARRLHEVLGVVARAAVTTGERKEPVVRRVPPRHAFTRRHVAGVIGLPKLGQGPNNRTAPRGAPARWWRAPALPRWRPGGTQSR